ncbi:toxin glutamine deamidase domain-containing protein [Microbispora sp. CA-135349]|uniref:toxin glutamine deamidase domain-containing protein n=1 Tax=Microbispora sp. CA-135349 TaxID=3239953 RepID=UPI003D94A1AF
MNQDRARRHARWRLPSGVYNPVVTADGRRWRDYEQAAEAPAPSLEDRRLDVRIAALPLGVDTMTMPVVPAARNGESGGRGGRGGHEEHEGYGEYGGYGPSAPAGRRAGATDPWEAGSPGPREAGATDLREAGASDRREDVSAAAPPATGDARVVTADGHPEDAEDRAEFEDARDGEEPEAGGDVAVAAGAAEPEDVAASEVAFGDDDAAGDPAGAGQHASVVTGARDEGPKDEGPKDEAARDEVATAAASGANGHGEAVAEAPGSPEGLHDAAGPEGRGDRPGEPPAGAGPDVVSPAWQVEWPVETAPVPRIPAQPDGAAAGIRRSESPDATVAGSGQGDPPCEIAREIARETARETAPDTALDTASDTASATSRSEWHAEGPGGAVDDGPEQGELADADDFWSAVLRDDTERDWLDGPGRPRRLEDTRPYGRPGGLAEADPDGQMSLAQAVSGRFPDPRGTWIRLINAEGPTEDAFRSNNAVDCALSVMSTWHGEPVVAARRQPEYDGSGRPLLTGETGGVARAEEWLGHRFEYVGHGRRAYVAIAQRLIFGGHGAAAVLITRWAGGGSHAWNVVNCRGEVLWIDAQRGHMAVDPPYEDVTGVFAVVIDRQGRRL